MATEDDAIEPALLASLVEIDDMVQSTDWLHDKRVRDKFRVFVERWSDTLTTWMDLE